MQKIIFEFKDGAVIPKGVNAQTCGEIMQELEERGELTPENLVDVARDENSPIHSCFWNKQYGKRNLSKQGISSWKNFQKFSRRLIIFEGVQR